MMNYITEIFLATLLVGMFVLAWVWQNNKSNTFDLTDVLLGEDGKASLFKVGQATALVITSAAFIILVQRDKLTEPYFYGYMTIWSGINLAKNLLSKPAE